MNSSGVALRALLTERHKRFQTFYKTIFDAAYDVRKAAETSLVDGLSEEDSRRAGITVTVYDDHGHHVNPEVLKTHHEDIFDSEGIAHLRLRIALANPGCLYEVPFAVQVKSEEGPREFYVPLRSGELKPLTASAPGAAAILLNALVEWAEYDPLTDYAAIHDLPEIFDPARRS